MSDADFCRLCAETKENFIGIYHPEGQKLGIESKIFKCLQIQVRNRRAYVIRVESLANDKTDSNKRIIFDL